MDVDQPPLLFRPADPVERAQVAALTGVGADPPLRTVGLFDAVPCTGRRAMVAAAVIDDASRDILGWWWSALSSVADRLAAWEPRSNP